MATKTLKINDNISITLTNEQIADIARQSKSVGITDYKQVISYEIACKVFGHKPDKKATTVDKIRMIARAINHLIDPKDTNFPDWKNQKQYKYYPYFRNEGSGLVFSDSDYSHSSYYGSVAFLKTEEASNFMGRTHIDLYLQLRNEF